MGRQGGSDSSISFLLNALLCYDTTLGPQVPEAGRKNSSAPESPADYLEWPGLHIQATLPAK